MTKCFGDLIGWTIEAYVDDIVVKSKHTDQLMADLEQTFRKLREDGLKLNHIPMCLNEAADMLAKVALSQELVPTSIFASELHKPSVQYEVPE